MTPSRESITVKILPAVSEIASEFDLLEGTDDAPMLRLAWLDALETTGCVGEKSGWHPHHFAFYDAKDTLIGFAPAYLKTNSEGEFVFDHAWANAARRFGVAYFPKLVVASPFTPATGSRFLTRPGVSRDLMRAALAQALVAVVDQAELSSAHVLFPRREDADAFADIGLLARYGIQFHFQNRDYEDFEGFLKTMPSKRRTQLRRERRAVVEQGLEIRTLTGDELTPAFADAMFDFYAVTVDKFYWGRRYLKRAFFETVFSTMRDHIEVVFAFDGKKPIAGAFNLRGSRTIFGRYWGATEERPFLHFNVCFYHTMERLITERLACFEPGAGGEHKLARGFEPTITHSVHYLRDGKFGRAIAAHLEEERALVEREVASESGVDIVTSS